MHALRCPLSDHLRRAAMYEKSAAARSVFDRLLWRIETTHYKVDHAGSIGTSRAAVAPLDNNVGIMQNT